MVQKREKTEQKKGIASKPTIQTRLRKRTTSKKLSVSKKERRSPEADGFIRIATLDVFCRKDTQHTQQDKKYRCGRKGYGKRRREERGKKKNGLRFVLGMFMFSLERVGMRNNHTVYHMRVGKQRNASQIGNEQQREEPFHYTP